jgi:hypothetical protein
MRPGEESFLLLSCSQTSEVPETLIAVLGPQLARGISWVRQQSGRLQQTLSGWAVFEQSL